MNLENSDAIECSIGRLYKKYSKKVLEQCENVVEVEWVEVETARK